MSDTPRTDALLAKWHGEWGADALLTLTRELERELHAMTLRCQAADRTANAALAARPEGGPRDSEIEGLLGNMASGCDKDYLDKLVDHRGRLEYLQNWAADILKARSTMNVGGKS